MATREQVAIETSDGRRWFWCAVVRRDGLMGWHVLDIGALRPGEAEQGGDAALAEDAWFAACEWDAHGDPGWAPPGHCRHDDGRGGCWSGRVGQSTDCPTAG